MPQSQTAANPRHQEEEKKDKNIHAQNKQTNVREAQRPAPSSPSELFRMLKQTEKRGQKAQEDFKTLSAPWYKPQSYTELRTTPGPPPKNYRTLTFYRIEIFASNFSEAAAISLLNMCQVSLLLIHFLQRSTNLTKRPFRSLSLVHRYFWKFQHILKDNKLCLISMHTW